MSFEERLAQLGLTLPSPPKPVATYVPFVQVRDVLFLSGVVPIRDGKVTHQGKLGRDLTKEAGYEAAKMTLLNALANIRLALGSLDRVKQVEKMTGYVASSA